MEETKSRRVFDFTSRDVPRVDEGKNERKNERKNSLELFLDEGDRRRRRPRRLVRDPLFFFVVEAKRHPRDGDPVFSALFFVFAETQTKQREKIWNGKRRREDSLFVSFLMFRYNSLFISLLFVATTTTTRTRTRTTI